MSGVDDCGIDDMQVSMKAGLHERSVTGEVQIKTPSLMYKNTNWR